MPKPFKSSAKLTTQFSASYHHQETRRLTGIGWEFQVCSLYSNMLRDKRHCLLSVYCVCVCLLCVCVFVCLFVWSVGCFLAYLVGWSVLWFLVCLVGWSVLWFLVCLVGWSVLWFLVCLVGWSVLWFLVCLRTLEYISHYLHPGHQVVYICIDTWICIYILYMCMYLDYFQRWRIR